MVKRGDGNGDAIKRVIIRETHFISSIVATRISHQPPRQVNLDLRSV